MSNNVASSSIGREWLKLALTLVASVAIGSTQAPLAHQPLPSGQQVFDAYVEAIGGLPALERIQNRVSRSVVRIPAAGIELSVTTYQARPNLSYNVLDSVATGKIESGSNGSVVWQLSATAGPQVLEGKERATQLRVSRFDWLVYWRDAFDKVENTGLEEVAGRSCYRIVASGSDLVPLTLFFDVQSHLLARFVMTSESAAGTIPIDTTIEEYTPVDGILLPHRTTITSIGPERVMTVESIEQNVELPADRFSLPPAIAKLVKK
jgi:hypothetical protein